MAKVILSPCVPDSEDYSFITEVMWAWKTKHQKSRNSSTVTVINDLYYFKQTTQFL